MIKIKASLGYVTQIKLLNESIYVFWQIMPSLGATLDSRVVF
jgi:hypothetical protein